MPIGSEALSSEDKLISEELVHARRGAQALPGFPGSPPEDLAKAYEIQAYSIGFWIDDIVGWKVGGIPPAWRERLGADWLIGPIYSRSVRHARGDETVSMPVFAGGFAAIEPEFVVQLGETRDQDRIFIGAEIASSPVPAINDYGPTAVVCDFGNNNGLLVGKEVLDWQRLAGPIEVKIWIDDELIGVRQLEHITVDALKARDFCLSHSQSLGRTLPPGTLISSGAITGVHEAEIGARSTIDFGSLGSLKLDLSQAHAARESKPRNGQSGAGSNREARV